MTDALPHSLASLQGTKRRLLLQPASHMRGSKPALLCVFIHVRRAAQPLMQHDDRSLAMCAVTCGAAAPTTPFTVESGGAATSAMACESRISERPSISKPKFNTYMHYQVHIPRCSASEAACYAVFGRAVTLGIGLLQHHSQGLHVALRPGHPWWLHQKV